MTFECEGWKWTALEDGDTCVIVAYSLETSTSKSTLEIQLKLPITLHIQQPPSPSCKMKSIFVALIFAGLAAADFQIFVGPTNDPIGGGTGENAYFVASGVQINCDNAGSPIIISDDSSSGGASCDGCGPTAPDEYDVTRFEIFDDGDPFENRQVTKTGFGTLTAYLKDGDLYDLVARDPDVDGSERRVGRCERRRGEGLQCPRGLTTDFIHPFMECFGEEESVELKD
ncbi:hypothetical protein HJFPF1_10007 [Paramyrothecium foliicola]|nr:hypothetical protein HJFPF1_10007 [Paramyrothecium foliicola]